MTSTLQMSSAKIIKVIIKKWLVAMQQNDINQVNAKANTRE